MQQAVQTHVEKDRRDGWHATTTLSLDESRELEIYTRRTSSGALRTMASVCKLHADGRGKTHVLDYGLGGGDFSRCQLISKPARVTEKVVTEQQQRVLSDLPAILDAIKAHYAKRQPEIDAAVEVVGMATTHFQEMASHADL